MLIVDLGIPGLLPPFRHSWPDGGNVHNGCTVQPGWYFPSFIFTHIYYKKPQDLNLQSVNSQIFGTLALTFTGLLLILFWMIMWSRKIKSTCDELSDATSLRWAQVSTKFEFRPDRQIA